MHTEYAEDEELIELAAKAAGITLVSKLMPNSDGTETLEFFQLFDAGRIGTWNPLKDDGDALRLAVNLSLTIIQDKMISCAVHWTDVQGCRSAYKENPFAATRKAITRAAASIGKNMK